MKKQFLIIFVAASLLPVTASAEPAIADRTEPPVVSGVESFEQTFVLTAYYSPLPDQCCYVKGGEGADKILNGEGYKGADGTAVYAGMLAAPGSYPFGTRIELPGLGVLTVHDRGGAIVEQGSTHRLDVWAGHGEEGLARALAFGVPTIKGKVYLPKSAQPAESFSFDALPVDIDRLEPYLVEDTGLLGMRPQKGQRGLSVIFLQNELQRTGFFAKQPTGFFGEETEQSLRQFLDSLGLREPDDRLTETSAAYLLAASRLAEAELPLGQIGPESTSSAVKAAQRLLRYVGFYRGRTNGVYDEQLFAAILQFQKSGLLVGDETSPGAGRIGPLTRGKLSVVWKQKRIAFLAGRFLDQEKLRRLLVKRGGLFDRYLSEGDSGSDVTDLQRFLAAKGYFAVEKLNGHYGAATKKAVMDFQRDNALITSASDTGAGTIGPATLRQLRAMQFREALLTLRGGGWGAL